MRVEAPRIGPVERMLLLKRIAWLAKLPGPDLALLGDYARERFWPRGATLLRHGEPVGAVHFVVDGQVTLRRRDRALGAAAPGSAVGARLLLAQDPAGLDAVAASDAVTLALDREAFLDALAERFQMYRSVLRETCGELVELFVRHPAEGAPRGSPDEPRVLADRELDLVDRLVLLRSRRPFDVCSINALAELSQRLEEVRFPAGAVLWRRGDRATRMLILATGRVRCDPLEPGTSFTLGPGQPTGTMELLAELPRWFDAVADGPVCALQGGAEQLLDVFEDNEDMGLDFLAYMARSSVALQERVAEREGRPNLLGCEGACG